MNYKELKVFTDTKWDEIKALEQEYSRVLESIDKLNERLKDISFDCQKKLDQIEEAHEKHNKAI